MEHFLSLGDRPLSFWYTLHVHPWRPGVSSLRDFAINICCRCYPSYLPTFLLTPLRGIILLWISAVGTICTQMSRDQRWIVVPSWKSGRLGTYTTMINSGPAINIEHLAKSNIDSSIVFTGETINVRISLSRTITSLN